LPVFQYNSQNLLEGQKVSDQFLRVKEAAKMLGYSEDTIRNWINRSKNPLPAIKAGRDWLIKRTDLNEFLENQKNVKDDDLQ